MFTSNSTRVHKCCTHLKSSKIVVLCAMKVCASSQADVPVLGVLAIQLVFDTPFHMAYKSVNLYFFVCLILDTPTHSCIHLRIGWLFSIGWSLFSSTTSKLFSSPEPLLAVMCKVIFTFFGGLQFFSVLWGNFPMPFVTQVLGTQPRPVWSSKLVIFFTLKCSLLSVLCAGFLVVSFRYLWSSPSPSMEVIPEEQFLPRGGERYDHCAPLEPTRYKLVIIKLQKWIPNTASLSALTFLQCSTQLPRFSSGEWNTNTGNNVACWEEEPGSKLVCLSLHMASWRPAMQYHREFITSLAEPECRILAMQ